MKFINYSLFLSILFLTCSKSDKCPPDQLLGSLTLMNDSKEYLPYERAHFIQFVDSAAVDTAVLFSQQGLISDNSRVFVENICLEEFERADKYYSAEHKTVDFFDLDTSRRFRIIGNLGINHDYLSKSSSANDPVLFDELKLTVHRNNPSLSGAVATLEFVVNTRNNFDRMSDGLKTKNQRIVLIPQVVINDSLYTDVYRFMGRDTVAIYYFKPLQGVVAFRDINNKWWNLHNIF